MKNLPIRLWISVMMAAIGLVRFVQSQFWSSPAHVNAHALEGAAEFFLGAWTVGVMHLVAESDSWKAKRAQRRTEQQ